MQTQFFLKNRLAVVIAIALVLLCMVWLYLFFSSSKPVIKIGILHSLTGTMVISEKPLVDALQFAMEEVNAAGGLNGLQLEAVIRDCRSDATYCAQQAEQLISEEKVSVLFGCWTSSSGPLRTTECPGQASPTTTGSTATWSDEARSRATRSPLFP